MKFRTIIFTSVLLTIIILSNHPISMSSASTNDTYSGLRTNRLILNSNTLTFTENDTFVVFTAIQNIRSEIVYDLNFNYSVDKSLFSIVSSTNKTQTSNEWVYYNYPKLEPNQSVSFNMTLQVVSNKTSTTTLNGLTLNYEFGVDARLPGTTATNSLSVNIQATNTSSLLPPKVLGFIDVDSTVFAGIFALPIIIGFILSFIFGRRRNKF